MKIITIKYSIYVSIFKFRHISCIIENIIVFKYDSLKSFMMTKELFKIFFNKSTSQKNILKIHCIKLIKPFKTYKFYNGIILKCKEVNSSPVNFFLLNCNLLILRYNDNTIFDKFSNNRAFYKLFNYDQFFNLILEEYKYLKILFNFLKYIKCNLVLLQKFLFNDFIVDLLLFLLNVHKIKVVTNLNRKKLEIICKYLNYLPLTYWDNITKKMIIKIKLFIIFKNKKCNIIRILNNDLDNSEYSLIFYGPTYTESIIFEKNVKTILNIIYNIFKYPKIMSSGNSFEFYISVKLKQLISSYTSNSNFYFNSCVNNLISSVLLVPFNNLKLYDVLGVGDKIINLHRKNLFFHGISIKEFSICNMIKKGNFELIFSKINQLSLIFEFLNFFSNIDDFMITN